MPESLHVTGSKKVKNFPSQPRDAATSVAPEMQKSTNETLPRKTREELVNCMERLLRDLEKIMLRSAIEKCSEQGKEPNDTKPTEEQKLTDDYVLPEKQDKEKQDILMWAVKNDRYDIVKLLIK